MVVQQFWCRKICKIVWRFPRMRVKSKFLYQDADVMLLADKCIVVRSFVFRNYDKVLMETESSLTTSGSQIMDSCLVLKEYLSRRILRFRTSAIALPHSERVSTSISSILALRLACSSHASMMILKFLCHENETGSLISGPCEKHLSVFGYGRYWDHMSLHCHTERIEIQNHSRNKSWDSGKDHRSLFAADLLYNCKFWKQPNRYSYKKKCMATLCNEYMEWFFFGQISDSTFCLNSKWQCLYWQIWLSEKGDSLFLWVHLPWQLWKVCWRKYPKWYPEVDAPQMQSQ